MAPGSESATRSEGELTNKRPTFARQTVWFSIHLAAIYLIVYYWSAWLAGLFYEWIRPILLPTNADTSFQFFFSNIFTFTFVPAFLTGLINTKYRHRVACFIWVVPALVLGYKFVTFPTTAFQNHFEAAFHHYFAGGFMIGEWRNNKELFEVVGSNSDTWRGMDQWHVTGPFYAGMGYSIAAFVGMRVHIVRLAKSLRRD